MKIGKDLKVGDLVHRPDRNTTPRIGTVTEFPEATHAKEVQKVTVLTGAGMQTWIVQYCEVICGTR